MAVGRWQAVGSFAAAESAAAFAAPSAEGAEVSGAARSALSGIGGAGPRQVSATTSTNHQQYCLSFQCKSTDKIAVTPFVTTT